MDQLVLVLIVVAVVVLAIVGLVLLRGDGLAPGQRSAGTGAVEAAPPQPEDLVEAPETDVTETEAAVAPPEPTFPSATEVEPRPGPYGAPLPEPEAVDEAPGQRSAGTGVVDEAPGQRSAGTGVVEMGTRERFRLRLSRARNSLGSNVATIFGRGLGEDAWDDLEEALISADVGVEATTELVDELRRRVREDGLRTGEQALDALKTVLRDELAKGDRELRRRPEGPSVWLVTGVNGTGKTTSIGKLAARHAREGDTLVLAAADTFRAAAAEQLELWGERAGARVVRNQQGADPAAVAFDGYAAAKASGADLVIVDTAGRLQNKTALMAELGKVKRVLDREAGGCDEVLLVLDATTGQNGLAQAKAFMEAVEVTGVVLTKLDGTAKGGIVVAIQRQLGLPVKLVGLGEGIDDLADFDPDAFVDALFAQVAQEVEMEVDLDVDLEPAPDGDGP